MKMNIFAAGKSAAAKPPKARARYLQQSIRLEEQAPAGIITGAVFLTIALMIAAIVWASVTEVNETARAEGEVIPAGLSISVQHPEGGLVRALRVREGDHVAAGDELLRLDDTALRSEVDQMRVREVALELQAERLAALLEDREPDFSTLGSEYSHLANKQWTIYQAQRKSHQRKLDVVDSQIDQREKELERQRNQERAAQKEVGLFREQVNLRRKLSNKKLIARTDLLSAQTHHAESQRELFRARDGVMVAIASLEEARQRRLETEAETFRDIELEAGRVAAELAEVTQQLLRLRDRMKRVSVNAPVSGVVQNLSLSAGQVVLDPGQVILQLIPIDDELVVSARISPTDIGHVREGLAADVSVDSYDTARFGRLNGQVRRLSASTYLDESRNPYYRAEIALSGKQLGTTDAPLRILPGMTVTVDIRTGTKTLMDYLLRPIRRGMDTAFGER